MWCCGKDDLKQNGKYRKSVFDRKQIDSLKRKFNYVSGNQQFITRQTFKKNIGYLGIRAVSSFLDRMFNSFDIDGDNKISFDDFIQYMEILKDGTDDQKAQISFNLIYMEPSQPERKQRKNSTHKGHDTSFQLKNDANKKKRKIIDMHMFEKFFEDFYKSWSSITNQSIPKETKTALKQFINQLFRKVQADGRKAIDIQYYKMLYKDREFMIAFRQINSKLGIYFSYLQVIFPFYFSGNFFIKSNNTQYQKNVTLFHKILKKIITLSQKVFPLLNRAFIEDTEKIKVKSSNQSPSIIKKMTQIDDFNQDNIEKYFYDAKRYEINNIFEVTENQKKETNNAYNANVRFDTKNVSSAQDEFSYSPSIFSNIKQNVNIPSKSNGQSFGQQQRTIYQSKLQQHVVFLERKLIYLQNSLKQIIDETKQIYNEMHNEFIKIFQRIQKQQYQKQSQMRQYGTERSNQSQDSPKSKKNQNSNEKEIIRGQKKSRKDDKKVFFGDKNFNLVLQIMVGIQMSVRSVSGFQEIIFQEPEDFDLKHTFEMDYGHFGQNDILYTFTDYAPNVFNHIRKIYGIGNEEYINSIGPNKMMSSLIMGKMASFEQLVSEGKSGSFFYHTQDGKYLIKTISQREFYFMRKILEEYFRHIKTNSQTLMPRIFGLHKITQTTKKDYKKDNRMTYYLLVMNNFFNTKDKITDRYDIKGSWVGRQNTTGRGVKKDLNFLKDKKSVDIEIDQKIQLYQIIQKDAQFFAKNQIIDYSLLLGFVKTGQERKTRINRTQSLFQLWNQQVSQQGRDRKQSSPHILQEKKSMNFRFKSQNRGTEQYLFGIIDILTEFNSFKQAQHLFKSCIYDSKGISAIPPQQYKNRFLDFLKHQVFKLSDKKTNQPISPKRSPTIYEEKIQESMSQQKSKSKIKRKAQSHNYGFQQIYYSDNKTYQIKKQTH